MFLLEYKKVLLTSMYLLYTQEKIFTSLPWVLVVPCDADKRRKKRSAAQESGKQDAFPYLFNEQAGPLQGGHAEDDVDDHLDVELERLKRSSSDSGSSDRPRRRNSRRRNFRRYTQKILKKLVPHSDWEFDRLYQGTKGMVRDSETRQVDILLTVNGKPVRIDGSMSGRNLRSRVSLRLKVQVVPLHGGALDLILACVLACHAW